MTQVSEAERTRRTAPRPSAPPATLRARLAGDDRLRGVAVATAVCVATLLCAAIPLVRNHDFYYADDSASQLVPMWYHLGTLIRGGQWPVLFDVNSWMGGNLVGEALFGTFNPVIALSQVAVSVVPNLAVGATLLKAAFMALLALGVYLVAREYGAARWAAAPVAIALPFAGFTLYFEASTWVSGLIGIAWVPHVWWSLHRVSRNRLNPLWAFLIGALAVTTGNPYGILGVVVVALGVLADAAWRRDARAVRQVLLTAACIGLLAPLVYLPLLGTSPVSWRTDQSIAYNGQLAPRPGDLLGLSSPAYVPSMVTFGRRATNALPLTYLAWFVLPLLPWLRLSGITRRLRAIPGPLVVTALFGLFAFGPSHLWMFRWPLRVLEPAYLGAAVIFAVLLSCGVRVENWRRRATCSGAIVLIGAYLGWAQRPHAGTQALAAVLLVGGLVAAAVLVGRRSRAGLSSVLVAGTALTLLLQIACFPENNDVAGWRLPADVHTLRGMFAKYHGPTLQLVRADTLRNRRPATYRNVLPGNAYLPARVDSVTAYTGIGFRPFADYLCQHFAGDSCRMSYAHLWEPTGLDGRSLADLLRLQTVVVDNKLPFHPIRPRPGWSVQSRNGVVTVLVRQDDRQRWPDGRVSYTSPGLAVVADRTGEQGRSETVRISSTGHGGMIAFARLNWPGYTARLDGRPTAIQNGPAGLITVRLPAGRHDATLSLRWAAPHYRSGVIAALAGVLGALTLGAVGAYRRLRRPRGPRPAPPA